MFFLWWIKNGIHGEIFEYDVILYVYICMYVCMYVYIYTYSICKNKTCFKPPTRDGFSGPKPGSTESRRHLPRRADLLSDLISQQPAEHAKRHMRHGSHGAPTKAADDIP